MLTLTLNNANFYAIKGFSEVSLNDVSVCFIALIIMLNTYSVLLLNFAILGWGSNFSFKNHQFFLQ